MRTSGHPGPRGLRGAVLAVLLSCLGPGAEAWGPLGHRAIALIAEEHLTPAARAFVAERLENSSMAGAANWADSVTDDPRFPGSIWYHFEKIPDGVGYLDNLRALPGKQRRKGGAVVAILAAEDCLRDPGARRRDQTTALKFLIHLVGDLHQPLHTGRPEDKGGVEIETTWSGAPMSLHRIWDSGLILSGHRDLFSAGTTQRAAAEAYARHLAERFAAEPVADETDVEAWLDESLALRPAAYELRPAADQDAYVAANLEPIDRRIHAAGRRLARMLNDIAAGAPASAKGLALRAAIDSIPGDPRRSARLAPRSPGDR